MASKNLSADGKVGLIAALAVAAILAMGWATYGSTTELFDSYHWVYHTHEVLVTLGTLNNDLADVQRNAHDFALGGDGKQLDQYRESSRAVADTMAKIADLTRDNPVQQKNMLLLGPEIRDFSAIYEKMVRLGKTESESQWTVGWQKRQAARAAIRAVVDQMAEEENTLLIVRNGVESENEKRTQGAIVLVVLFAALLAIGIGFNLVQHIKSEKTNIQKLREKDAITAQFLESLPMGVFVASVDGKPYYVNKAAMDLLGQGLNAGGGKESLTQAYRTYVAGTQEPYPPERSPILQALQGKKTVQDDMEIHRPDGEIIPIEVTGTPILADDGKLSYAITSFWDISERKKYQATLKNISIHDELTGLLNRRGFFTLADQQMITAERLKVRLIMLFIDLDGLKRVNDSLGHQAGDEMIKTFGRIVGEHFRKIDIVARMGGDEFGVLAMDQSTDDMSIIRRLRERVDAHNASPATRYRLDFSVGSSMYDPERPSDLKDLIALADERMYAEKRKKKESLSK